MHPCFYFSEVVSDSGLGCFGYRFGENLELDVISVTVKMEAMLKHDIAKREQVNHELIKPVSVLVCHCPMALVYCMFPDAFSSNVPFFYAPAYLNPYMILLTLISSEKDHIP